MLFYMCVCRGGGRRSDPESSIPHYITKNELCMYNIYTVACPGIRKGGGAKIGKTIFVLPFTFSEGGAAQKISEKMIFPTKKEA